MKYFVFVLIFFVFFTDASPDRKSCNRVCTREFDPICGYDGKTYKIFSNSCMMRTEMCKTGNSWSEVGMADCLQHADKPEHCQMPCTKEFDPTCASNGKEFKIFPNKCEVKNGKCIDGINWYETRMSDCNSKERNYSEENNCEVPCTREYDPICGTNGLEVKLFPNKCVLQNERCKDGRNWQETRMTRCNPMPVENRCRKPCTLEYRPVCGTDGVQKKVFPNKCVLQNAYCDEKSWRQIRMEECSEYAAVSKQ